MSVIYITGGVRSRKSTLAEKAGEFRQVLYIATAGCWMSWRSGYEYTDSAGIRPVHPEDSATSRGHPGFHGLHPAGL